jgi:phage/plasmid-like protein (TIGR03299 family)
MSHAIESTDRLTLVGKPAWHGLGVVLPSAPTVADAFRQALPWEVEVTRAHYHLPNNDGIGGRFLGAPGQVILARSNDGLETEPIAVVGPDFKPTTNADLASLATACEKDGRGIIETIGSLRGRKSVFALMRVGSFGVGLNGDDETHQFLALTNSHDGTAALRCFGTSVRVVCANTLAAADTVSKGAGITIRHTGDMEAKLDSARKAIALGNLALAKQREEDRALASKDAGGVRGVANYFSKVASILYPAVALDRPEDPKDAQAWERARARAHNVVKLWVEEFNHERQALVSGSAYSALQAVTYWADHQRPRVQNVAHDRLLGRGANVKAQARKILVEAL